MSPQGPGEAEGQSPWRVGVRLAVMLPGGGVGRLRRLEGRDAALPGAAGSRDPGGAGQRRGDRLQQAQGCMWLHQPFFPVPLVTACLAPLWPPLPCHWLPLIPRPGRLLPTPRTLPGAPKETHKHPGPLATAAPTWHGGGDGRPPALGVTGVMGSPSPHPGHPHPTAATVTSHVPFHGRWHSPFLGAAQPLGSGSRPPISCHGGRQSLSPGLLKKPLPKGVK